MLNGNGSDTGGSLERLRETNRPPGLQGPPLPPHPGRAGGGAPPAGGGGSRSELVEITGLSRTTITSLLGELHARGLITAGSGSERSERLRGRPPVLIRLAPSAGAALGVAFGHSHVHVAISDLSSTVLAERRKDIDVDASAAAALDAAAELIDAGLEETGIDHSQVIAAGMGVPGPIAVPSGRVGSSSILPGWEGLNPAQALAERLGDVHVEAL